ncbi:MAG: hypothetical protein ACM3O3_12610 [Syntrophothermus sp.]
MYIFLSDSFYEEKYFDSIVNSLDRHKPIGGLWVSKKFNNKKHYISYWQGFCISEGFNTHRCTHSTELKIKDTARIYRINSYDDYDSLVAKFKQDIPDRLKGIMYFNNKLDYEALSKHYDVLELTESGVINTRRNFYRLELYGWDIPSSVILNKDVIIPVRFNKLRI